MAGDNLQQIFNVLPQVFDDDLHKQWNRTAVLLGELAARPGSILEGGGKNCSFAAEFSGATGSTVAEGADVADSEYTNDIEQPMIMPWVTFRTSFKVTEQEIDAARSSGLGAPSAIRDIFGARILSAGAVLADKIENSALVGTGVDANGNPDLVGIYGGAIAASGAYGGINVATFSEWAGNVSGNSGTPRALTADLLEQVDANIFVASSRPWNLVMTSAGVARKYTGLFMSATAPMVRMNDNASRPQYGQGVANDANMQFDALFLKGRKVLRNRLNPTQKLALLNTDHIRMKYLPRTLSEADKDFIKKVGIEGSSGGAAPMQATGMPMRLVVLAKTGDSIKVSARITCSLAITRRNAQALLTDINES